MPDPENAVFISYRRSTSSFIARAVFMDLHAHGVDVFMDVESIDAGQFERIILNQIAARPHFLVILTPGSLDGCSDPGDWLRREIEYAIDLKRNIIPVLVNEFRFDDKAERLLAVSPKLSELPRFNSLTMPHEYFDAAMERLRARFLKEPIYDVPVQPTPASDTDTVQRKIAEAASKPTPSPDDLTAEEWFNRGLSRDESDLEGKIADYTNAIRLNPRHGEAYSNRGRSYYLLNKYEEALADHTEAIGIDRTIATRWYNRAITRRALGDNEGAVEDHNEALRRDPKDFDAYNGRAVARKYMGDIDGALEDYTQAITLNPTYASAYFNRALLYQERGDLAEALYDFEQYLASGGGSNSSYAEKRVRELRAELES